MKGSKKSGKLAVTVYFISILIILMLLVFTASALYQRVSRNAVLSSQKISAGNQIEIQNRLMLSHFKTIKSELLFLPKLNEILRFKEIKTEEDRLLIENEFLEFISSSGLYDQIRFIDKSGMELTRVNYNNGSPSVTPKEQLQNKSDRYYFTESISIQEGRIYISPFDLNVEHGKIEQPLKPMIRFGTPIFDSSGEVKGIVILNFLGQIIIDDLKEATNSHAGIFSLLNSDGFYLYNNKPEDEWGFMLTDEKTANLQNDNPSLWKKISSSNAAQIITEETIYSSIRVTPLKDEFNIANSREYILLNTIPLSDIGIDKNSLQRQLLKTMVIALIISILLSSFLSVIIVQRNKYREALEESALYDLLTGLPNRKLLEERAVQAAAHAKRYKNTYAVMFIDLDGFKPINDTLGHNAGDSLLKLVGEFLTGCVRETDTVARFGGDEFVILLSQISDEKDCANVAEKILSKMFNDIDVAGKKVRIGASIGIASVTSDSSTEFEQAMRIADAAMYDIKKSGKNNYKIVSA